MESRDALAQGRRRTTRGTEPTTVSVRQAAAICGVSKSTVQNGIQRHLVAPRPVGRPKLLRPEEDDAIVAFVIWLQRNGFPASKRQVEMAAHTLLKRRNPDAKPPTRHWYSRWVRDHPEVRAPAAPTPRIPGSTSIEAILKEYRAAQRLKSGQEDNSEEDKLGHEDIGEDVRIEAEPGEDVEAEPAEPGEDAGFATRTTS